MAQDKIERNINILCEWNPAKEAILPIVDFNNYESEKADFLFSLEIGYDFTQEKINHKQALRMLKAVLNEAFNLNLSDETWEKPTLELMKILNAAQHAP